MRPKAHGPSGFAADQAQQAGSSDNRRVRKLLACLLLAIVPVTPSWAGVAIDCSSDTVVQAAAQAAGHDESTEPAGCCGDVETRDVQCGSDCSNCHGLGLTALTGLPMGVGLLETGAGDSTHPCRITSPVPSEPLRPPSGPAP